MENTLGKRIAAYRKSLRMTQEQLAEHLGITAQAVSKWENDQSCPDISMLPILADIFNVSTDVLLGRTQIPAVVDSATHHGSDATFEKADAYAAENNTDPHHNSQTTTHPKHRIRNTDKLYLLGTAVWFLSVGILYLLSKVLHWDCSLWDILWPSFLLVFGVFGLIKNISLFWLACTSVGAFFLINNIFPLPIALDKGILWAIIIIICGFMLLLDALRKKRRFKLTINNDAHTSEYRVQDHILSCSNSFGEEKQLVIADRLDGGEISNSFGEYSVDLSGVETISENCAIEVSCSFGEMEIVVPKRFEVIPKCSKFFAVFSVNGTPYETPNGQIFLKASVSFGELTIRYI